MWFKDQAQLAGASIESGLYVGLRLDGRVRASGKGCPPWQAFSRQLPPMSGEVHTVAQLTRLGVWTLA